MEISVASLDRFPSRMRRGNEHGNLRNFQLKEARSDDHWHTGILIVFFFSGGNKKALRYPVERTLAPGRQNQIDFVEIIASSRIFSNMFLGDPLFFQCLTSDSGIMRLFTFYLIK